MPNIRKAEYSEEKHRYVDPLTKKLVPSVTQVLAAEGIVRYDGVSQEVLNKKSIIGSQADIAISFIEQGFELEEVDPRVQPYVDAYRDAKVKLQWNPFLIQNGVMGPAIADVNGMPVGFCPDQVGLIAAEEYVGEVKCTAEVYPSMGVQLAGYDLCLGDKRRRRLVLQLFPTGRFKLWDEKEVKVFDRNDYTMFQNALGMVWWKHQRGILTIEEMLDGIR